MRGPEIAFTCPGLRARGHERPGRPGTLRALRGDGGRSSCRPPSPRGSRWTDAPVCQGEQMYVQRDFNQRAGLAIVIVGAALAPFTPYYASLFVAAAVDAVLYLLLPEITICYRCGTHFRGFPRNPKHQAFDLHIAEQYGRPALEPD